MKHCRWIKVCMAAAFLLSCLSCEDEPPSSATEGTEVSEYRVAVVMPCSARLAARSFFFILASSTS